MSTLIPILTLLLAIIVAVGAQIIYLDRHQNGLAGSIIALGIVLLTFGIASVFSISIGIIEIESMSLLGVILISTGAMFVVITATLKAVAKELFD